MAKKSKTPNEIVLVVTIDGAKPQRTTLNEFLATHGAAEGKAALTLRPGESIEVKDKDGAVVIERPLDGAKRRRGFVPVATARSKHVYESPPLDTITRVPTNVVERSMGAAKPTPINRA